MVLKTLTLAGKIKRLLVFRLDVSTSCLIYCLLSTHGYGDVSQLNVGAIDLLPDSPVTYQMRDWQAVATNFDNLAFDTTASGQFLPLVLVDTSPQSPLLQTSFGLPAYVGETRTFGETGEPVHEAISSLAAVLGGTLVGIDKATGPLNWVSMTREYYRGFGGHKLILNTPFSVSGQSAWYDTYPNILFYSIADHYPDETYLAPMLDVIDDEFFDAVDVLTNSGTNPNFNHTAYNFNSEQPVYNGVWREPDMGLGMAWLQHAAYFRNKTVDPQRAAEHLNAVDWSLAYYENTSTNPDYEILLPFGVYSAARMNAEHGRNFDIQKLVNWVFTRSDARPTKTMISGEQWGGEDAGGLMGFTVPNTGNDVRGYAFSMNTFATAMPMVPLVRYEDRYSHAIGKWILNAANAARLYYANAHTSQNQSSSFWTEDPHNAVAYEGLRHHWLNANDNEELFAGGDPLTYGWGPLTDFGIYGSALAGVFGSIIKTTNVQQILQLDLLATDSYHEAAFDTYLYYNPLATNELVQIDLGSGQFDLYDAVSNRFLSRNKTGLTAFAIDSDKAVQLVLVPAGGVPIRDGRRMLVDGIVIDYNATLVAGNLVRNPYVDVASPGNPNRPAFWHYSSNAQWSSNESLSPSHSLQIEDENLTGSEEWRSYATEIPEGEQRELQVRWFWNYDIAPGEEFQGRLRLSTDMVTGLDLTNPLLEFTFIASGESNGFEMFETTITIPDDIHSFDLTFISGSEANATGLLFVDDISVSLLMPTLNGDYNGNGIVDAADYAVWLNTFGSTTNLSADGDNSGEIDEGDYDIWKATFELLSKTGNGINTQVPEPGTFFAALLALLATLSVQSRH